MKYDLRNLKITLQVRFIFQSFNFEENKIQRRTLSVSVTMSLNHPPELQVIGLSLVAEIVVCAIN